MKKAYRLYRRRRTGVYYLQNNRTGEQQSLRTSDKSQAEQILRAKNSVHEAPSLNLDVGLAYISHADPKLVTRTWKEAMDELMSHGKEVSQQRCAREFECPAYNLIRNRPIMATTGEDLKAVLKRSGSATNNYLRRLHNLAVDNGWLHKHLIPPKKWDKPAKSLKRAISLAEHHQIIAAEQNEERRHYYEMLWLIGAAQTDGALLSVEENVDWANRILSYQRRKTGECANLRIGTELEVLLRRLPPTALIVVWGLSRQIGSGSLNGSGLKRKTSRVGFHWR